jgi:acetyl-CoA carboxylase carboxyl transferase subunit beta
MGIFKKRTLSDLGEKKKDMPEGLWTKCPSCGESLFEQALAKNLRVCTQCGHHFTLDSGERIANICDEGSFEEMDTTLDSVDALGFKGYVDKVKAYQAKTGLKEAVVTGRGKIEGIPVLLAIMDFRFLGASMGSVVGEKITRAIEAATAEKKAVIVFSASGGARMHEGILSLMQMAKTSGALARHAEARLPYISVLTHPTTGGVTASFATLGDIIIAEPKCMIGFAGPRVVKETTHSDLPPGFQTAEFMMEHGLVDMIIQRKDMRSTLARLLGYVTV